MKYRFSRVVILALFCGTWIPVFAQDTDRTVVLRSMLHPAGPSTGQFGRLSDHIWRILKVNLSNAEGVVVQEVSELHLSGTSLESYASLFEASHIIIPTFDTTSMVPVFHIRLKDLAARKNPIDRPILLNRARREAPTDMVNDLSDRIIAEVTGKQPKETLFSGCFAKDDGVALSDSQLYKLPRKLKNALKQTNLFRQYELRSFPSPSFARETCRKEAGQLKPTDYGLTGEILPGKVGVTEVWIEIQRYEAVWKSIEQETTELEALEQDLATRIASCFETGDGCSGE